MSERAFYLSVTLCICTMCTCHILCPYLWIFFARTSDQILYMSQSWEEGLDDEVTYYLSIVSSYLTKMF